MTCWHLLCSYHSATHPLFNGSWKHPHKQPTAIISTSKSINVKSIFLISWYVRLNSGNNICLYQIPCAPLPPTPITPTLHWLAPISLQSFRVHSHSLCLHIMQDLLIIKIVRQSMLNQSKRIIFFGKLAGRSEDPKYHCVQQFGSRCAFRHRFCNSRTGAFCCYAWVGGGSWASLPHILQQRNLLLSYSSCSYIRICHC